MKKLHKGKKALSVIMALAMCVGAFTACSTQESAEGSSSGSSTSSESKESESSQSEAAGDTEIVISEVLVGNPDASIEIRWQPSAFHFLTNASDAKAEYLTERMTQWCEANPDVKFTIVESGTNISTAMTKTLLQATNGSIADMVSIDSYMFPRFAEYAQPIGSELSEAGIETEDFYDFIVDGVSNAAGDTVGLWYTTDVRFMFYRSDLLDAAPTNWEELDAAADELKSQVDIPLAIYANKDESAMVNTILPFYFGHGAELFENGEVVFGEGENRDTLVEIFNYVDSLLVNERISDRSIIASSTEFDPDVQNNQVGMIITGNSFRTKFAPLLGGEEAFDEIWTPAPIPMKDSDIKSTTAGGWVSAVFTEDPEKKAICVDFMSYLYGDDEGMAGWCEAGGYLPTRKSVYETSDYFSSDFMKLCGEQLEFAHVRPSEEAYSVASTEIVTALGNVLIDEDEIDSAIDKAFEAVKSSS